MKTTLQSYCSNSPRPTKPSKAKKKKMVRFETVLHIRKSIKSKPQKAGRTRHISHNENLVQLLDSKDF